MDIEKIPIGRDPPRDVNALIEIPLGGVPVKYGLDKGLRRALRGSLSAYGDVLSRQLRIHPPHAVRRWRSL